MLASKVPLPLPVDVVLHVTGHRRHDLDTVGGQALREALLAGFLEDRQVAAIDHPHAARAGSDDQRAEMPVELGGAAGKV